MKREVWLVRHPEVRSASGLCYGRLDVLPDDADMDAAIRGLQSCLPVSACHSGNRLSIISSPLNRCLRLAEGLVSAEQDCCEPSVAVHAGLQEMDFGEWEGHSWDAIDRTGIDAWANDPWHYAPGGGETAMQVLSRWRTFKSGLFSAGSGLAGLEGEGPVLTVTHAGVIRMALFDAGLLTEADLWLHKVAHGRPFRLKMSNPT